MGCCCCHIFISVADGISGLACTVRIGAAAAAPGRSPCPNRTSALEKAIHGFAENPGDDVIVPALGTSFDCLSEAFDYCHWTSILLGEAYDFYNTYSWVLGFSIRNGDNFLNVKDIQTMQEYKCQRNVSIVINLF